MSINIDDLRKLSRMDTEIKYYKSIARELMKLKKAQELGKLKCSYVIEYKDAKKNKRVILDDIPINILLRFCESESVRLEEELKEKGVIL